MRSESAESTAFKYSESACLCWDGMSRETGLAARDAAPIEAGMAWERQLTIMTVCGVFGVSIASLGQVFEYISCNLKRTYRIGSRKAQIRYTLSRCAVWAVCDGLGSSRGSNGGGVCQRGHVFRGTSSLCASIDGQSRLAALSAKGITRVPIEESSCLRVDSSLFGGKGHVHTAFDELQTARLHRIDQLLSRGTYGTLGCDVESEVWRTMVDGVSKSRLFTFIKAEEQKLRDREG